MFGLSRPLLCSRSLTRLRSMSSTANASGTESLFVVYAPDYADEGAVERRLKVRSQHLVGAKSMDETKFLKLGGAFFSPESAERPDAPRNMIGSMMVVRATSLAEVKAKIEADIYWTAGVWDKERLMIAPFAQAKFSGNS